MNRKNKYFLIVYKTQNCHRFSATAAAECMTMLRLVNIQKKTFSYDLETLSTITNLFILNSAPFWLKTRYFTLKTIHFMQKQLILD